MTAQILTAELGNLIQESKRKHADLRNAAEKALEELKALRSTSEAQIAADLTQRPNFVTPFLIACGTKNVKFTGIAIVCLQRLVVSKGLAKSRLREVLEAFREATSAGLDVQLKILQALPSFLQNYADELKGELLAGALNICTILQASKNGIVNNTAAATLQQLVVAVFDKVVSEDRIALEVPTIGEAPTETGTIQLRAAALDAYRVFNDLCLLTESQKPKFLRSAGLPRTFGLELIESVLTNHAEIFLSHPEQAQILRIRVMPFIISAISEKQSFAVTVRIIRILYTLLRRHLSILGPESEMALSLLTHTLDQDTALWKRALIMEVLRGIFAEAALIRRVYAMYDAQEGKKSILRDLVAAFVRISSEKPSVIGLRHQSTIPVAQGSSGATEQAMLEASGVPGIIGSSVGSSESSTGPGISNLWSTMRVPCIDQLDKTEPPVIPDSYIYGLTLACINGFAEGLAKFILPLTVPERPRRKAARQTDSDANTTDSGRATLETRSNRKNPIPVNPLTVEQHPSYGDVKLCAGIVDDCWPALLATCSTFLYAALDQEYYHGLVRSFQKFTHVAGLLRLATPRDAFLTTLGKAAVPPNILTATTSQSQPPTPIVESSSMFSHAKGLLSVDNSAVDRRQSSSLDGAPPSLNTRNLLCLRALLNLGIALGPTLGNAWVIILETLQEADLVLFSNAKTSRAPSNTHRHESQGGVDNSALLANFSSEIKAVEVAASRLLESTFDFPNDAFLQVVTALCALLGKEEISRPSTATSQAAPSSTEPRKSFSHRRMHSINTAPATQNQEDLFALAKLGEVANVNIGRLTSFPPDESGWYMLNAELITAASATSTAASVRCRAAEILVGIVLEAATATIEYPKEPRGVVQVLLLRTLSRSLQPLQSPDREMSVAIHTADVDVHKIALEGLKRMLEQCGDTFVSGWEIAFEIIRSVFLSSNRAEETVTKTSKSSKTRSPKLIRSSFNSLQLICSDFLASLPNSCFLLLIDTLYKFCMQNDDLNIALTANTFFWVLSDFILHRSTAFSLSSDLIKGLSEEHLVEKVSGNNRAVSDAALWMLLLLRLTAVSTDERLELRNSAIQILLRIFDAYGDQLSAEAWSMCLKSVIFRLLSSIEEELETTKNVESTVPEKDIAGWHETTVVVLSGIMDLLANYLNVLTSHPSFESAWQTLLDHFRALLDFEVLEINTAVFKALKQILSRGNRDGHDNFNNPSIDLVWDLWSHSLPLVKLDSDKHNDNAKFLLAYVSAGQEIYRLIHKDLEVKRVNRMLELLRKSIQEASSSTYSADIEYLTPLQNQVMECLKMIRTDIEGVPASLISQIAEFVALAFLPKKEGQKSQRPTYVALSKAAMELSKDLVLAHASDESIYTSGALSSSLTTLARLIVLKYSFPIITKSISPWRQATASSLTIIEAILPVLTTKDFDKQVIQPIWTSIVDIANGITTAHCTNLPPSINNILADQDFDIQSFTVLRDLITPALGSALISDQTRRLYTSSLFHQCLIHAPLPKELPAAPSHLTTPQDLLALLSKPRKGRTVDPPPTPRKQMSYLCLTTLFSLLSHQSYPSSSTPESISLAQAAAPYLLLRCGLTLRAYIADQPLRGRMPQPLEQRKELLYILKQLVELRAEPEAIPEADGCRSREKRHLVRLYPLLVRCVGAARHDVEVGKWVGRALGGLGEDFGV